MKQIKNWLSMAGAFAVKNVLPSVVIIVIGLLVIRLLIKLISGTLKKTKMEMAAISLIKSVVRIVLYLLLALIVASNLGIDVTGIVALASVLTLAISLSVQNALTNVIGGFTLINTKPFLSGDFVEIAGQSGTVKEIGLTYTKLATADNKIVSIPNSAVVSAQIVNYTTAGTRRVDVTISADYSCPVELVLEALREAGNVPTAFQDPAPFVAVKAYGESAISYVLQMWCKAEDYWTTSFDANRNIQAIFDAKGIKIARPHINVHLDK